jgi:prepilin-type N-terminal cleavage/methylation domain-containing protein
VISLPSPGRIDDERGLTLPEVLVALAIIGIGLVGVAAVIPVSTAAINTGDQLSTATFLAEQMIERARSAAWTADPPVDCLGVSDGDAAPRPAKATCEDAGATRFPDERGGVAGHPGYQRVVRVAACEASACGGLVGDGIRLVTVTVSFRPTTGAGGPATTPRSITLEWLAARR